jgi:thiol-disulfide isomerase/thioredoxin
MDNSESSLLSNDATEPRTSSPIEEQAASRGGERHQLQQPAHPQAPRRNPAALFFVAALVATMLYIGFHAARRPDSAGPGSLDPAGKSAPDFTLESLDGKNVSLSSFRGQVILLNFWATWCGPCKIEMPWFVELQKEYGPQGLQIVGVAMDDASKQEIAKFAKDMNVNYTILIGKEAVGQLYGGVDVLPTTFFIDRDGKIISREFGLQSRSLFVDNIKKALSQGHAVQAQR